MIYSEDVKKAMVVSYEAHRGMFDRGGFPYFAHPLHVAEQMTTEDSTVAALLHDVVEDTNHTVLRYSIFTVSYYLKIGKCIIIGTRRQERLVLSFLRIKTKLVKGGGHLESALHCG